MMNEPKQTLGGPRGEGGDAAEERMEDWYGTGVTEFEEGEVVRMLGCHPASNRGHQQRRTDAIRSSDGPSNRVLGVDRVVPCHYGTFPLLSGSPDELRQNAPGVDVHALDPGESLTL